MSKEFVVSLRKIREEFRRILSGASIKELLIANSFLLKLQEDLNKQVDYRLAKVNSLQFDFEERKRAREILDRIQKATEKAARKNPTAYL